MLNCPNRRFPLVLLIITLCFGPGCDDSAEENSTPIELNDDAAMGAGGMGGNGSGGAAGQGMDAGQEPPVDANVMDALVGDAMTPIDEPESSQYFLDHIKPELIPGRFPSSDCADIDAHHVCVSTPGCGWLRTIKNNGICRQDPVARCITSGECLCRGHDFHGTEELDEDLELFVPLSIMWQNLAPRTANGAGDQGQYTTSINMPAVLNESLENFTSRTDFSHKTLNIHAQNPEVLTRLSSTDGLSLSLKFMHVWDAEPGSMSGTLFDGLGISAQLDGDRISITIGGQSYPLVGEDQPSGAIKAFQCNQLTIVMPPQGDGLVYLGGSSTPIPGLNIQTVSAHLTRDDADLSMLQIGAVNAKVWDLRLYANGRQLTADEINTMGRRCGTVGDYEIPPGYPESNRRYSWGMGGYNIVPNHQTQHFSSGVYVTMWIPETDAFPPVDPEAAGNLRRMIGFWDRWHEQMFFEFDMIPFTDTRQLQPEGSVNTYRNYRDDLCAGRRECGEPSNYNNPCRYVTDLFQGFNWLQEDFPGEATSADHRRIAERGGWTRWSTHNPELYTGWSRPVHEHGHTAHFTLMRTYRKVSHYIRGIAGESFAEIMSGYVLTGLKSWMNSGLTYYPTIPVAFEGRWDQENERHIFKSPQPYQERNIDDLGLGARFYGLGVWWTYVSHYAGMPYLIGWLSGDTDQTPGTTIQKMRFYLAQEGLDLGELFGNYAAHTVTWDWPHMGHHFHDQEQEPFEGIARWCTENSGPDCTVDSLKIQADVSAENGTEGQWVDSPEGMDPGGFAYSTIRIAGVPGGSTYEIGLAFDVPEYLYPDTQYSIGLPSYCRSDDRFFSSRIVVADAGSEGQAERPRRPQYYKIPGHNIERVIIQVPEGSDANIYLLAVPTPPFELEDVIGFVNGFSLTWPFRYKVRRLDNPPADLEVMSPIILDEDKTLDLTVRESNGFVADCFGQ